MYVRIYSAGLPGTMVAVTILKVLLEETSIIGCPARRQLGSKTTFPNLQEGGLQIDGSSSVKTCV